MSDATTRRMIKIYEQIAAVTMFFSGMFQSPAENFYQGKEVEYDIERSDEDISIVVTDLSTGHRMNEGSIYTNKSFVAPIHKEAITMDSVQLLNRQAGETPFQDPLYRANLISYLLRNMVKVERKIRRAIELQAAQVLQTGTITLTDENGVALYTLDFKPKATHYPDAATKWGETGEDKLGDLESLADVIRNDGLQDADQFIFGKEAWRLFQADTTVLAQLDNRRVNIGVINRPEMRGNGGKYHGDLTVGTNVYELWTYDGKYKHPQTGVKTNYMDPAKVIVRYSGQRLDATFGGIPNIGKLLGVTGPGLLPELPGRISNEAGGMDLHPNVWLSSNGEDIFAGVGARPLMIPTAIDQSGCLDTLL